MESALAGAAQIRFTPRDAPGPLRAPEGVSYPKCPSTGALGAGVGVRGGITCASNADRLTEQPVADHARNAFAPRGGRG